MIPVEIRYSNENTKVTFSGQIASYYKTTCCKYPGKDWVVAEHHADVKKITNLANKKNQKPERTLIFIHPPLDIQGAANLAIQGSFYLLAAKFL